jgi:pyruvate/2-oxoacid:ferredoxin oxidoreductase alpha subunit
LVGVGFASRPNLTEGEIKKAVDQKRLSLLRERKANMSNQEMVAESKIIAETLKKFESDLRAQGSEDEQAYVVLPDDRAEQLLMSKGSTIAPTKRQVQKMTEVEKLMKSRGLNKK